MEEYIILGDIHLPTIKCFQVQGSLNKFPDFFRMGIFIDSKHMKL